MSATIERARAVLEPKRDDGGLLPSIFAAYRDPTQYGRNAGRSVGNDVVVHLE